MISRPERLDDCDDLKDVFKLIRGETVFTSRLDYTDRGTVEGWELCFDTDEEYVVLYSEDGGIGAAVREYGGQDD